MKTIHVWYDNKENVQMIDAKEKYTCEFCSKILRQYAVHYAGWSKKRTEDFLFCEECVPTFRKKQSEHEVEISRIVLIKSLIPRHAILVANRPPDLRWGNGSTTVFEPEKIPSDAVVDKTVHVGRLSVESATIGNKEIEYQEDKFINNMNEFDKFLEDQIKSQPLLEDIDDVIERRKIEDKNRRQIK